MIRKAYQNDIYEIEKIYERIHDKEENGQKTIGWIRGVYPTKNTAEAAFENSELFVETDADGKVVAAAIINKNQLQEYGNCLWKYDAPSEKIMVLHTLVVDPQEQGKGFAGKFVDFYERIARESGCIVLRLDTNVNNINARKMYLHLGFIESGIVPCVFNGIEGVELVCLEKKI